MPKVSVIIPVYNVEKYLRQCLDSVVNQTLKDIEIICVDDGSTDGSPEILAEYAKRDARLKVLSQPCAGAAAARNAGLRVATGDYLHFMDSDDVCHRNLLKNLYAVGCRHSADIVICGFDRVSDDMSRTLLRVAVPRNLLSLAKNGFCSGLEMSAVAFSSRTTEYCWNRIVRRSFVQCRNLEFQDLKRNNDLYFARMSLALAKRISFCNKRLYRYRRGIESVSAKSENAHFFCEACAYLKRRLQAVGMFDSFGDTFFRLVIQVFLSNLNSCKTAQACKEYYGKSRPGVLSLLGDFESRNSARRIPSRERLAYDALVSDETPVTLLFALNEKARKDPSFGRCIKVIVKTVLGRAC